jgi:hypothetical protein
MWKTSTFNVERLTNRSEIRREILKAPNKIYQLSAVLIKKKAILRKNMTICITIWLIRKSMKKK